MMKKYWKSAALVLVIVVAISIYYVQTAKLSDSFTSFAFKKVEGNAEAAEAFMLKGAQQSGMAKGAPFKVTPENGTEYLIDESFFTRLQGYYKSEKYEQRKKNHRSFMRDKLDNEMSFYENEKYLAYANVEYEWNGINATLNIDVLHKDSNESNEISIPVQQINDYGYLDVSAITMQENQLILITESYNHEQMNINQYTVDLNKEEISDKELLYSQADDSMNGYTSIDYLFNEDHPTEELMIVARTISYPETENGEVTEDIDVNVFDLMTNKKVDTVALEEMEGFPVGYTDEELYYQKSGNEGLSIVKFDREQDVVGKEVLVSTSPVIGDEADIQHVIQDGNLYISIFAWDGVDSEVAVINLDTMETAYKGKVVPQNVKPNDDSHFYFNNVEITKH